MFGYRLSSVCAGQSDQNSCGGSRQGRAWLRGTERNPLPMKGGLVMIGVLLSVLLGSAWPVPRSFVPPKGWTQGKNLPPGAPDAIWLPPSFGKNGNGENLAVITHRIAPGTTLASEVQEAIQEMSDGRIITGSRSEPTCQGRQPGWTFKARLAVGNGVTVSQIYHIAVVGGRAYGFIFTHKSGDPIDRSVVDAIQSICPH